MIQRIIKKVIQLIIMLAIVYAGSFVMMEETSEKTEKTEKSEEALHSTYHSGGLLRTISKSLDQKDKNTLVYSHKPHKTDPAISSKADFNLEYIYFTSFLRASI